MAVEEHYYSHNASTVGYTGNKKFKFIKFKYFKRRKEWPVKKKKMSKLSSGIRQEVEAENPGEL